MKRFEFQGDWFTTIELSVFSKELNNPKYSFRRRELNETEYEIEIHDVFDANPDLSKEQKNTITHIQDNSNQRVILNKLFIYLKEIVYPEYQHHISEEEYPGTFPPLNNINDLNTVIGLDHIILLRFGKDNTTYYNLMFESSLDDERGLGFVIHENSIIEHGPIGGLSYEKVANHMGLTFEEYSIYQSEIQTPSTQEFQYPSQIYGKLKPWQENVNEDYPFYLYSLNNDDRIIREIELGTISIHKAFEKLRHRMLRDKREILINFFISNGHK